MAKTTEEQFFLQGKDAEAVGTFKDKGFVVKAGAMARKEVVPSAIDYVTPVRNRLLAEGVLQEYGSEQLRFTKDHLFDSPSGAAATVLGRSSNGWVEWKHSDGRTLSDVKRVSRPRGELMLTETKRQEIADKCQELLNDGKVYTETQLQRYYATFRERFGPDVLARLNGVALLELMHDHGNKDSLVYWLEWKSDEEFDTKQFGSIAGGSALKFRVFRRKETGNWQAGDDKNKPKDIPVADAIELARTHRDQLLKGVELLEQFPQSATDDDYAELQDQMDELAPDVSAFSWGHKYLSLLFPEVLDDYHNPDLQRFHILKLLQLPPEGAGRYICAGRFVAAAKEVGVHLNQLAATLNSVHGSLHRYWRVGTRSGRTGVGHWPMMRDRNTIAVGWPQLGDLSWVEAKKASRAKLKDLIHREYPTSPQAEGKAASEITHFIASASEGDVIWAADGATILGIGRLTGEYRYETEFEFPHQRSVEWLHLDEWKMPFHEGLQTTFRELGKYNENLLATEQRIQQRKPTIKSDPDPTTRYIRLTGIPGRIQSVLERKAQVILYGPPGTGKTFWAEKAANDLAAVAAYGKRFENLQPEEQLEIIGDGKSSGLVRLCCFHPAYGYEDFLEGYRPQTVDGQVAFELRDGVFKKLCADAMQANHRHFFLIVDEINRGDIPRIFGELLTTLEKDKRGKRIILPISQEVFSIPKNVFLIGTMNTADRSISLLDAALRRRFGFVEMMPDGTVLRDSNVKGIPLRAWFDALNERIRQHVGRDARNLQIGHSYLLQSGSPIKEIAPLKRAIRDDIIPLLEEYCYEDYGSLARILGDDLVDVNSQRVRHELFDDGQEEALVQGLLAPYSEISTSSEAISSDESAVDEESEEDDSEEGTGSS
jgi:5-methylcytosine-specific restriction protein B